MGHEKEYNALMTAPLLDSVSLSTKTFFVLSANHTKEDRMNMAVNMKIDPKSVLGVTAEEMKTVIDEKKADDIVIVEEGASSSAYQTTGRPYGRYSLIFTKPEEMPALKQKMKKVHAIVLASVWTIAAGFVVIIVYAVTHDPK